MLKVMVKNLYRCFCTKTEYSFILKYKVLGKCRAEDEKGLNTWNQGKTIEIS